MTSDRISKASTVLREMKKENGASYSPKRWQLIVKTPEENPRFVADPREKNQRNKFIGRGPNKIRNPHYVSDPRTAAQKRKTVWKQNTRVVHGTKSRANQELAKLKGEILEAESLTMAGVHVPEYVRQFVSSKRNSRTGGELSTATKDSYRFALINIDHPTLDIPLQKLDTEIVEAWLRALRASGKGESVLDKSFRLLKQAMKKAAKDKLILTNPLDYIDYDSGKPAAPKRTGVATLDTHELKRLNTLLDGLNHSQMADCARFALLTGMRESEICGLRWMDVTGWDTGEFAHVNVRNVIQRNSNGESNKGFTKNGTWRKFRVNRPMHELLSYRRERMIEDCNANGIEFTGTQYVFGTPSEVEGRGFYSPGYLCKVWRYFADSNNVRNVYGAIATFHSLRHAYASHGLEAGISSATIAYQLGHSDPSITERIYHDYLPEYHSRETDEEMGEIMSMRSDPREGEGR